METTETTREATVIDIAPPSRLAPVFHVVGAAKKVNWTWYVTIGAFVGSMTLYMGQWQKPAPPEPIQQKYDVRNIPAFNEAELTKKDQDAINQHERNVSAFLNEERQRTTIAVALQYQGLAMRYIALPNHKCTGLTQLQCLNTFDANRITDLQNLSNHPSADAIASQLQNVNAQLAAAKKEKNVSLFKQLAARKAQLTTRQRQLQSSDNVFAPLLDKASEVEKVEGLRLARILATPAASRAAWQQEEIDMRFPLLNAGLPPEELQPRPATLAKLLQESVQRRDELLAGSKEQTTKTEACLSLPPDQQPNCR